MSPGGRTTPPDRPALVDRPWLPWAATALFWIALTGLNVASLFLRNPDDDPALLLRLGVGPQVVLGFAWILLSPIAIRAVRRHPLDGPGWARSLSLHLALAVVLAASTIVAFQVGAELLRPVLRPAGAIAASVAKSLRYNIHESLLYYAVAVAATALAEGARTRRERERAASRMRDALAEARLDALRFRLQPDFILSTLRMLPPLVERDGAAASRVIVQLGEVLHRTFRSDRTSLGSLRDEADLLRSYLEIERSRHGERLEFQVGNGSGALGEARLPSLVLLPLAQHAVAIGVGSRPGPSRVSFLASHEGDDLTLTVTEEGPVPYADAVAVLTPDASDPVARRLQRLYGGAATVRRRLLSTSSHSVEVRIPFRTAPPAESDPPRRAAGRQVAAARREPCAADDRFGAAPASALLERPLLLFGFVWAFSAIYYGTQYHLQMSAPSSLASLPAWRLYGPSFVRAAAWALLTPFFLRATRAFPVRPRALLPTLAAHVALAATFGSAVVLLVAWVSPWFPIAFYEATAPPDLLAGIAGTPRYWAAALSLGFLTEFLTGLMLSALAWGQAAWRRTRGDAVRTSQLEAALASARIGALESQLRPHFLFNTLNAVLSLVATDPKLAIATLVRLGDILRVALDADAPPLVSLAEEIDFCRRYLEIEQTRFQDRLAVSFRVDDSVREALVPNLLLQPIVENAVKHGISRRPGSGTIDVAAQRRGDRLEIRVANSAPGGEYDRSAPGTGVGLENVRQRLYHLFGASHSFSSGPLASGGFEVSIGFPVEIPAVVLPPVSAG